MKTTALSLFVGTSLLVGAIALPNLSNAQVPSPEIMYICEEEWEMDEFTGLELSDSQQANIESLETQLAPEYEALEAQLYTLEAQLEPQFQALDEQFESELISILTPQQLELARLNILTTDFPELDGLKLTSKQIETLWQMSKAFDADLHQLILAMPAASTPETMEAQWEEAFEDLEATYSQKIQTILTADQYQVFQQNLEAMDAACEG